MKEITKRRTSLLLSIVLCLNFLNFKKKDTQIPDMISGADGNAKIRQMALDDALKENIEAIKQTGISNDVFNLKSEDVKKLLSSSSDIDCSFQYTGDVDEMIALIKNNSDSYSDSNSNYVSFFNDDYFNKVFTNVYGKEFSKEEMATVKETAMNALFNIVSYVLTTGTKEDIHNLAELKMIIVPEISNNNTNSVIYADYNAADNLIRICFNNILNFSWIMVDVLAETDEAIIHEVDHCLQRTCSDKEAAGANFKLSFLNKYFNSFVSEAAATSFIINNGLSSAYEKLGFLFSYSYPGYRSLETKLMLCSLFNGDDINDYYKAINSEDINAYFNYLNAYTDAEKKEMLNVIYAMDALEGRNTYMYDALDDKDDIDQSDILKIVDNISNLHYITIFKYAINSLMNYNFKNSNLSLQDNLFLYYIVTSFIAEGAFIVDDLNGYKENTYFYIDEFYNQYKIIESNFFQMLSVIYHVSYEEIETIYSDFKQVDLNNLFIGKSNGFNLDTIINDRYYPMSFIVDKLYDKFPKLDKVVANYYLYNAHDASVNYLALLDQVNKEIEPLSLVLGSRN